MKFQVLNDSTGVGEQQHLSHIPKRQRGVSSMGGGPEGILLTLF